MHEITNDDFPLWKLITNDILSQFATATGYDDWEFADREIEMMASGQIGEDGYTVSVDIERTSQCEICFNYDHVDDIFTDACYACDHDDREEWLDSTEGVTKTFPASYDKFESVAVTGRFHGVDLVFHTPPPMSASLNTTQNIEVV